MFRKYKRKFFFACTKKRFFLMQTRKKLFPQGTERECRSIFILITGTRFEISFPLRSLTRIVSSPFSTHSTALLCIFSYLFESLINLSNLWFVRLFLLFPSNSFFLIFLFVFQMFYMCLPTSFVLFFSFLDFLLCFGIIWLVGVAS